LRNYGVLVTGESVEEAFLTAVNLMAAVDTQVTVFTVSSHVVILFTLMLNYYCHENFCMRYFHFFLSYVKNA